MQVRLNDREMEALQGLPWFARCLYVFGIRPYMDYRTGTVGIVRGVSWQSIAEALYVEPHQGETDSGTPDKSRVRRAAARLEKAGLVVLRSMDKRLVFQCLLADTDQSAPNKPDTNPTQTRHSEADTATPNNGAAFPAEPDTNPTHPEPAEPDTPPVSGIRKEKEEADARASAPLASSSAKRKTLQTLDEYAAACKAAGVKLIPETDPVFAFADSAGIPHDWLYLCWREFARRYREQGKRQRDWPQTFRNCVRGNWYGLWKVARDGSVFLTSEGELIRREVEAKEEAA